MLPEALHNPATRMQLSIYRTFFLIILMIAGSACAQAPLPKCVLFSFGNCTGSLRFSNGDIYTGEFNYGRPNGKGAFTYGNGDVYKGTVVEGQRHGSGTYVSAAGDKYVGQFNEGNFEGVGTYYFLANNRSKGDVYTGEFRSSNFNGQGRYIHANGQMFFGSFVNGQKIAPILAPETLLTQAGVQPIAATNAAGEVQLKSSLGAERHADLGNKNVTVEQSTSLTKLKAPIKNAVEVQMLATQKIESQPFTSDSDPFRNTIILDDLMEPLGEITEFK